MPSAKSAGPKIALVHTGPVERRQQQPDDRRVDPEQRRLHAGRRRSASQNGRAPISSRNDGRKIATRQRGRRPSRSAPVASTVPR